MKHITTINGVALENFAAGDYHCMAYPTDEQIVTIGFGEHKGAAIRLDGSRLGSHRASLVKCCANGYTAEIKQIGQVTGRWEN